MKEENTHIFIRRMENMNLNSTFENVHSFIALRGFYRKMYVQKKYSYSIKRKVKQQHVHDSEIKIYRNS
jgi:hypothetical protein